MNMGMQSYAFIFICLIAPQASAQEWLNQLPESARANPTVNDLKQAFDSYYGQHPADLTADKLKPTFRFEGEREEEERLEVEQYKMFQRWEWLTGPRAYPEGRLDLGRMATYREQVKGADAALLAKDTAPRSFNGPHAQPLWRPLGPSDAIGGKSMGRVTCIAFDPKNANVMYLCAADGGVWKSTDGGGTWSPKLDSHLTLSTGDIAIDPNNPNTLYLSTGDPFGYGVPFWGGTYSVGVVKSTDGGATWSETGFRWTVAQNRTIRRLVMHPTNSRVLMAATSAGLFRTVDGGANWTQILTESTYDVEFQQDNGAIAYATGKQVMKSTDAGASFHPLNATCAGTRHNIAIARSDPNVLYALCTDVAVQKSTDAGATWTPVTKPSVRLYGYYDNVLTVSPVSADTVYVAGFNMERSTDGGKTWTKVPEAEHPDNHVLKFAPGSGSTLFSGNDGGIFKSTNSGATWKSLNKGLSITQFYRIGISRTNPEIMVAGAKTMEI